MHDIHEPTKEAALELIPKLRAKGYQLVTVSELAKYQGYTMKKGNAYSSFR
jgi:peptidoglycan/xylan/chitin deacetylase (PgdA/CDA1 family)